MASTNDSFIEKEVVLTIRVPADFDREDERMLDDEFSSILERQGWELLNSQEYRNVNQPNQTPVNHVTITRERYSDGESWSDHFWVDADRVPSVELFKAAIQAYLQTPEGKVAIQSSCYDFNWGDGMLYVPTEMWNQYGIYPFDSQHSPQEMGLTPTNSDNQFSFTVDQDEVLIPDTELERDEPATAVPAAALPKGWCWHHEMDGSGALRAPDGKSYFHYDRAPYHNQNGIEYKESADGSWDVFWGSFDDFVTHAENHISQTILRTSLMLGEHDIPGMMQSLAGRAWQGNGQNTVQIRAGDHIIKLEGYTYEPSYEYFSATASISLDDQVLYGLDGENVGAYQNKVVNIGIYEKLEDAIAHIKEHTNGHDYVLLNDVEQPRPKLGQLLSDAQTRSAATQPQQNSPLHKSREH